MKKRSVDNLVSSLIDEEKKIKDKFDKAELYLKQDKELKSSSYKDENELIREGISLLKQEANHIEKIRAKVMTPGFYPSKSEIFRAGILALTKLSQEHLLQLLSDLPKLKPGRKKI